MFIVPVFGCFVSQGVGQMYAVPTATERPRGLPAHPNKVTQQSLAHACSAWLGAHGTISGALLVSAFGTHDNSGALQTNESNVHSESGI